MNKRNAEFTNGQLDQVDAIHNAIQNVCKIMIKDGWKLEWDMSLIGPIAEDIAEILVNRGYSVFYPYMDDLGNVFDYYEPSKPPEKNTVPTPVETIRKEV